MWRSLLYVPANVERFIEKAQHANADAIILDLEDSVPAAHKGSARAQLSAAIQTCAQGGADVLVRINRPLELAVADLEAAMDAGCKAVLAPKVMGPDHVALLAEMIDERGGDIAIVAMVETANAVQYMHAIARAPRVCAMIVGTEDIAAEIGCAPDSDVLRTLKLNMVTACAAAGIAPLGLLDSVADFKDQERLRGVALEARANGYAGATCIHPSAVPILNAAFSPSEAELNLARRQLETAAAARAQGRGSAVVDGRMIDAPILRRAAQVLRVGERTTR